MIATALNVAGIYFILGLLFALFFVIRGCQKMDIDAEESSLGFRLLIFPGSAALWPLLLLKLLVKPAREKK